MVHIKNNNNNKETSDVSNRQATATYFKDVFLL